MINILIIKKLVNSSYEAIRMIQDIIDNNSYPIVFIGSGMSKRYLANFPTWNELLQEYWKQIKETKSIYHFMRKLEEEEEIKNASEDKKEFLINVKTASYIKKRYDDLFYDGEITLEDLSQHDAYVNKVSPFNYSLTQRFSNYKINEDLEDEIDEYRRFLSKAKVIVTTNYDTLTEDLLNDINQRPTVYVGQKGFFDETYNWSELFKIHGDVNDPSSIVITEEDYRTYDENSILISAKILSNLIHSPIVFLGYSLTDRNVQKLLTDFASQLPNEDTRKSNNRITVVEYKQNTSDFEEQVINNPALNISHSIIKTDNYMRLFQEICKIDQGLTPYEVSKFESKVKNIVLSAGGAGKLDSVLVSSEDLGSLPEEIKNRRIVVALGDKKNIFMNPSLVDYIDDYFKDGGTFLPEIALRFIAKENPQARLPFVKYLKDIEYNNYEFLSKTEKTKLDNRLNKMGNLDKLIDSIPKDNQEDYENIEEILSLSAPPTKKLELIVYNIKKISQDKIWSYIEKSVLPVFKENYNNKATELSAQRRLLLAYDLLKNGNVRE